jgi:hypothetical protein
VDVDGRSVADQTTTSSGAHLFVNLPPAAYKVTVITVPTGYVLTKAGAGSTSTDSSSGSAATSALVPATSDLTLDFGFFRPVTVGDYVFNDRNYDGIQNADDMGSAGVRLHLTLSNGSPAVDWSGSPVTDQTTATDGSYAFTNLPPGTHTVSTMTSPPGAITILTGLGTSATDSSTSSATSVTLTSGSSDTSLDFGYYQLVTVGDFAFEDVNGDGIQDGGDVPLAGVVLGLTIHAGQSIAQATTGADGHYYFIGLVPGDYAVSAISAPAGYVSARTGAGTVATDSSTIASTGVMASGDVNLTLDFGFYRPVRVGNRVWRDTTLNGRQDPGEPVAPNVTVTVNDMYETPVASTTFDSNGNWAVSSPFPGTYTVTFTVPVGYLFVPATVGEPAGDSNANAATGASNPISLSSGQSIDTVDAGVVEGTSVAGNVYPDNDGSKTRTAGDVGISLVPITVTGLTAYCETVTETVLTSAEGQYRVDLPPGTYSVVETQPARYVNAAENPGSRGGIPTTNRLDTIVLNPGDHATGNDFGEAVAAPLPATGTDTRTPITLAVTLFVVGPAIVLLERIRHRTYRRS